MFSKFKKNCPKCGTPMFTINSFHSHKEILTECYCEKCKEYHHYREVKDAKD